MRGSAHTTSPSKDVCVAVPVGVQAVRDTSRAIGVDVVTSAGDGTTAQDVVVASQAKTQPGVWIGGAGWWHRAQHSPTLPTSGPRDIIP